jgi:dTDP-glucose pyrophosphorylase
MTSPSLSVWGLVLAGGDGARLLRLTRYIAGQDCPKQFCAVGGVRTLLSHTLARIAPLIAPGRTMLVLPVRGVRWSDWGTPERVVRTLRRMGTTPPWLAGWVARPAGRDPGAASIKLAHG